eukprot:SM000075S21993  [mRNA]  locus=s75:555148:555761:+ [translate_table: standard]
MALRCRLATAAPWSSGRRSAAASTTTHASTGRTRATSSRIAHPQESMLPLEEDRPLRTCLAAFDIQNCSSAGT